MQPVERFEAMLAAGRDDALLRFSLGMQYLRGGDALRAVPHLRRAVEHDPGYSAAWKLLGQSLAQTGDADAAMQAYRAGLAAAENKGDKQAAKEMAVFLRRLERAAGGS
jgi:Tfp pilus assembly protein PilF